MQELQIELPSYRWRLDQFAAATMPSRGQDEGTDTPVFLVVEDDWVLRHAIAEELAAAGWRVVEAESGETALEYLEGDDPIDALIADVRLSGAINGWDVAEAFRAKDPDLPVIYVSGNPVDETRRVANSVFLPKPCDAEKLIAVCRALIL